MNRPQVLALFASVSGLVLMCEPAAAQHPYFIARGQVEAAALGTYLSPTAAYPIGPMYYPTAMPAYAGSNLYWRLASAEHVVPGVPAPVEPQGAVAQAQVTQAQVTKAQVTKAQVAQAPAAQARPLRLRQPRLRQPSRPTGSTTTTTAGSITTTTAPPASAIAAAAHVASVLAATAD